MHWRFFENAFWRPVLSPAGDAILEPQAFQRLLAQRGLDWSDYPFRGEYRHFGLPAAPFGLPENLSQRWQVKVDEQADAVTRAQAYAANDMIIVGGVFYRRSLLPMWALRSVPRNGQHQEVALVMPDLMPDRICLFSLNRCQEAITFAEQIAHRLPLESGAIQGHLWPVVTQEVQITSHRNDPVPDDYAFSFVRIHEVIDRALQGIRFGDIPRGLLAAHTKLEEAKNLLIQPSSSIGRRRAIGAAVNAVNAISACTILPSAPSQARLERALHMVRVQQWRIAFKNDQADTKAFADM
ncbi:hypothetical protein [Microvirga sp. VF16]|uniref:hypothetical protein n=1 Tax=Microvirga sp. VF16 TaxID=2807101 RepID=UPI00193D5285|nr:hypothetical protein [Microvirga sp. VF16]QRM32209.1 hypothetical protein JO965_29150 [Microvirga sp. VF16]